jgi:hypothetical protein
MLIPADVCAYAFENETFGRKLTPVPELAMPVVVGSPFSILTIQCFLGYQNSENGDLKLRNSYTSFR